MKSIYSVIAVAAVLIAVPYTLAADGAEMKTVPFWWSTDPLTGEQVYTDYFASSSSVQREHNAYLAQSTLSQSVSTINPSIILEAERSNMVEVITYEYQWIKVRDSQQPQGPFANPDFVIREKVAVSTWVEVENPVVDSEITEDVTTITPEIVPEITEDVTVIVTESEPERVSNFKDNTHWDVDEADYKGHSKMTTQEFKDMKKKHAEWKAYELASQLYPSLYPPYVHEYDHDEHHGNYEEKVVETVVEEEVVIVVPLQQEEVVVPNFPTATVPNIPVPEPVPVPEVLVEPVIPEAISIVPQIEEPLPFDLTNDTIVVPLN
jgi:hypothetical protein